jgi:hypothetical protein
MADRRGEVVGTVGCRGGVAVHGGGPAFTVAKIKNFLTIMGEVAPIGPMEWGIVAEWHKELFGAKNQDILSL